jgi:hypothetical protein
MKKLVVVLAFLSVFHFAWSQREGIKGQVFWISGNQMPGPGNQVSPQQGVVRELLIYKAASLKDVVQSDQFYQEVKTELVGKVQSGPDGSFKVKLPPGEYSVFTQEQKGLFANGVDRNGCISCVTINPKKFSWITITVDYEAVY